MEDGERLSSAIFHPPSSILVFLRLSLSTFAADHGHVLAVLAYDHSAAAACFAGFFGGEFVGGAFCMRGFAAFAGDGSLFVGVH